MDIHDQPATADDQPATNYHSATVADGDCRGVW